LADWPVSGRIEIVLANALVKHHEHVTVGQRLLNQRRLRGLTQQQLAKKSGLSASWIHRVEVGEIDSPGLDALRQAAKALDLPLDSLTGVMAPKHGEVEKAIANSDLDEDAKRTLIRMYRALSKE
jgi:transcriptional regulator with XRE-family HTH domain